MFFGVGWNVGFVLSSFLGFWITKRRILPQLTRSTLRLLYSFIAEQSILVHQIRQLQFAQNLLRTCDIELELRSQSQPQFRLPSQTPWRLGFSHGPLFGLNFFRYECGGSSNCVTTPKAFAPNCWNSALYARFIL